MSGLTRDTFKREKYLRPKADEQGYVYRAAQETRSRHDEISYLLHCYWIDSSTGSGLAADAVDLRSIPEVFFHEVSFGENLSTAFSFYTRPMQALVCLVAIVCCEPGSR